MSDKHREATYNGINSAVRGIGVDPPPDRGAFDSNMPSTSSKNWEVRFRTLDESWQHCSGEPPQCVLNARFEIHDLDVRGVVRT
jgi:hypothetical protein